MGILTNFVVIIISISFYFRTGLSSLSNETVPYAFYSSNNPQYGNALLVDQSCADLQQHFSSLASTSINCAVENARPITICRNCALQYNATYSAFQDLQKHSFGAVKCKEIFFQQDALSVVEIVFSGVSKVWQKSNCAACYKSVGDVADYSDLSADTKKFIASLMGFNVCVNESSEGNKSVCTACQSVYKNLTDVYSEIIKGNADGSDGVCWDIVDAINVTQHMWSDKYHCKHFVDKFIGVPNIVISVIVMLSPITFYIIMRFLSVRDHLEIFRTKRRSFVRSDSTQPN